MQDRLKSVVHDLFAKGIRLDEAKGELERLYIECAMAASDGNLGRAAALLGLHRNTLTRKLAEHRRAAARYGHSA